MPVIEFRPVDRRDRRNLELARYASKDHSQHGEPGVLRRVMEIVGESDRWMVEFGAGDGIQLSNSRNLIVEEGWRAVLIEAHPGRFKGLEELYAGNSDVTTLNSIVGFEAGCTLDYLLSLTKIPNNFDILVIDIDGNDWHILNSIKEYRPKIIMIEFNPTIPNDVYFIQDKDEGVNQGSSLLATIDLAKSKGYELVFTIGGNGVFCDRKYYENFGIEDNSIDAMYLSQNQGRLFITYDGTLYNIGLERLSWTSGKYSLEPDSLQIVPEEHRKAARQPVDRIVSQARLSEDGEVALEILARGLETYPGHPRLLHFYSGVAKKLEKWDVAAEALTEILERQPTDDAALHMLSLLEDGKLNDFEGALRHAERAYALNPAPEAYALNLSNLLLKRYEAGRAMRVLQESAEINPASFRIVHQLVILLGRVGRLEAALAHMRRFKDEADPLDAPTMEKCRTALVKLGLQQEAQELFPETSDSDRASPRSAGG